MARIMKFLFITLNFCYCYLAVWLYGDNISRLSFFLFYGFVF
jgi:hypothetical protein